MNKLLILAVLACMCLLSEARVNVLAQCPRRARAKTNVYLQGQGYFDVRGSGSVSWSLCDERGRCRRGEDSHRGSRTQRRLRMYFHVYYSRPGSHTLTARLVAGGRTAISRCSFVVS